MQRFVFLGLTLLVAPVTGFAFPIPPEPKLAESARATWRFPNGEIRALAVNPSGEIVIVAGTDVFRWPSSGKEKPLLIGSFEGSPQLIKAKGSAVRALQGNSLDTWIEKERKLTRTPNAIPLPEAVTRFEAADSNRRLVFWTPGGSALFQSDDNSPRVTLKMDDTKLNGLALSPDNGRLLAAAFANGSVQIYNLLADGSLDRKCSKRFPRRESTPLVFSPDGRLLAIANGGRLILLDVNTAQIVRAFERRFDDGDITTLAFSEDGTKVAVGTQEPFPIVRAWRVDTGELLGEFTGHRLAVTTLAFQARSDVLVSGSRDGRVVAWRLKSPTAQTETPGLADAWIQLDSIDPKVAQLAMDALLNATPEARKNLLKLIAEADLERERLRKAISQLDHDEFRVRETARDLVVKSGYRAMELMNDRARKKMGAEGENRITMILDAFAKDGLHRPENEMYGDTLRFIRAMQVLESDSRPDARPTLEALIKRFPNSPIAREARAILQLP